MHPDLRTPETAEAVARRVFGTVGVATRLPGEIDINYRIDTTRQSYLLRITPHGNPTDIAAIDEVMIAAHAGGIPSAEVVRTVDGKAVAVLDGAVARLHTWIDGLTYEETGPRADVGASLGALAAQMGVALEKLPPLATTSTMWDLAFAQSTIIDHEAFLTSPHERRLIKSVLDRLSTTSTADLSTQVIHGDLNPGNLVVEGIDIVGVLDFGDARHSLAIGELAIAVSYAMLNQEDPVSVASDACSAYVTVRSVTDAEADALLSLVLARLATSVVVAASRSRENPHHHHTRDAAVDLLARILPGDLARIDSELHMALGRPRLHTNGSPSVAQRRDVLGPSLSLSYERPLTITSGRGAHLFDDRGRRYLDCVNNVCHVGHAEPRVATALSEQAHTLNTNTRYLHPEVLRYADRLRQTLPEHLDTVFIVNSGSEANELAIRLVRSATGRFAMACVEHGYHGNSTTLIDLSHYKFAGPGGFGRQEWVHVLPSIDGTAEPEKYGSAADEALSGVSIAGAIIEAMSGCGGQLVPAEGVLARAYDSVRRAGGLVIADEVQTGFGRVGTAFWAFELHEVVPDVVTFGKPAGNGHPLAGVLTTKDIAAAFDNGMEYFNTFGGNPVSAAVGNAVLDVIAVDALAENARRVGDSLLAGLKRLAADHAAIHDARGSGLFIGIEFVDPDDGSPRPTLALAVVEYAKANGVLLSTDGPHNNVIKIKPPLCFTAADANRVIDVVRAAVTSID